MNVVIGNRFLAKNLKISVKLALGWFILFCFLAFAAPLFPFAYNPNFIDVTAVYQKPFSGPHFLGTDQLGRDVFSNIIFGSYTALWFSVPIMLITTFLGIAAGSIAGYYGNNQIRFSLSAIIMFTIASLYSFFYIFYINQFTFTEFNSSYFIEISLVLLVVIFAGFLITWLLNFLPIFNKKYIIPIDSCIIKLSELTSSIPRLILLLAFAAFFKSTIYVVLFVILITNWSVSARLIRAEILKIKEQNYVAAAQIAGIPSLQILFNHILPNAIPPVIVAFTFGVAGLMGLETTLSFLGIGIPTDVPSWGRLIIGARLNLQAWWLIIFPGLFLIITILSIHTLANWLIFTHQNKK